MKEELERIWNDRSVRSANHYLVWTVVKGHPNWRNGRYASCRKRPAKRKVSRQQSQETS